MNRWKSILGIILCAVALTACESANDIKGSITASGPFQFKDKDGKIQSLNAGVPYKAILHMSDKGSMLEITIALFTKVNLVLPNPVKDQTGKISIAASDSKQAFQTEADIELSSGNVDASHADSCIMGYSPQFVCGTPGYYPPYSPYPPYPGPGYASGCYWQQVPIYGSQWIQETLLVSDKTASLSFQDPSTQQELANFQGSYRVSSTVSDLERGPCLDHLVTQNVAATDPVAPAPTVPAAPANPQQ